VIITAQGGALIIKPLVTNRDEAPIDLSRHVEEYYRGFFDFEGREKDFEAWMHEIRGEVAATGRYGADPAVVLHCLICTRYRTLSRREEEFEAIQRIPPRTKALIVAGLRALRASLSGLELEEIFGLRESGRARMFLAAAEEIEALMTGAVARTPAWQQISSPGVKLSSESDAVAACMICLVDELQGHGKPTHAAALLMKKAGLLSRSRGGSVVRLLERRLSRVGHRANEPGGPIGTLVGLMRSSYASLRDFLIADPEIPDSSNVWTLRARAWRTNERRVRRAFQGFCREVGSRGTASALRMFDTAVVEMGELNGSKGVAAILRSLANNAVREKRSSMRHRKRA
jgi:hypothetical protein